MQTIVTRAPGKLVLTGEYAVLEQAPAVAAAVNLEARVRVDPSGAAEHSLTIANTGARYRFRGGFGAPLSWIDSPGANGALLQTALDVANARQMRFPRDAVVIEICTQAFYERSAHGGAPIKRGIGSSAAVAVTLCAALQRLAGTTPTLEFALRVHQLFQSAKGSGIDVAASWHGGVIVMTPGTPPAITPVAWPEGLTVVPVWSGVAASTTDLIARLDVWRSGSRPAVLEQLCTLAGDAAEAWRGGQAEQVCDAMAAYAEGLKALDDAAGIGIWSAEHNALKVLAASSGVGYKPSGAGGGDYGLAFSTDAGHVAEFCAAAEQAGFSPGGIELGTAGLKVTDGSGESCAVTPG